jgi:hypothetical protein
MQTLLLDQVTWDLLIDSDGNIAVASDPYSQAQDAASAIKTFQGEVFYDTALGVPYWQQILGKLPPTSLVKAKFIQAALTVPGVVKAACYFTSFTGRLRRGQVQITNDDNQTSSALI